MSVKQTKRSIEWHEPRSKKLTRPEGAKGFSKSQVLHVLVLAFGGRVRLPRLGGGTAVCAFTGQN